LVSWLLLPPLALAVPGQELPGGGPPGLFFVAGGRTTIGSRTEDVAGWIEENPQVAGTLVGETPQHVLVVPSFYLMPTEVTNEQYAAFVSATGSEPPLHWAGQAIEDGRRGFLEEEGRRVEEARALGRSTTAKAWDPSAWWDEHWRDTPFEVPGGELALPVVYVDYEDALSYARWAGLRLMTEFEYQRAARGNSERIWPWGSDWNPSGSNSIHDKDSNQAMPVASFPAGAIHGVHDLVGNVWEWTASPYAAYPGYRPMKVKLGRGTLDALAEWDPAARVLVGGSFAQTEVGCRIGVRQKGTRDQRAQAVGFRCAASIAPGKDSAEWIRERFLRVHPRAASAHFAPERAATLRRWTSAPGTARVEGYAVITGYEQLLFCPVDSIPYSTEPELARASRAKGPVLIGFLTCSRPIESPPLAPGTYLVSWRVAGESGEGEAPGAEEGSSFRDLPGFSASADGYVFHDLRGMPVAAVRAAAERGTRGEVRAAIVREPSPAEADAGTAGGALAVRSFVSGAVAPKTFPIEFELRFAPGTIDSSWR